MSDFISTVKSESMLEQVFFFLQWKHSRSNHHLSLLLLQLLLGLLSLLLASLACVKLFLKTSNDMKRRCKTPRCTVLNLTGVYRRIPESLPYLTWPVGVPAELTRAHPILPQCRPCPRCSPSLSLCADSQNKLPHMTVHEPDRCCNITSFTLAHNNSIFA